MHSLPQKTFTPEDGPQGCSVSTQGCSVFTKNKLVFFVETALGAKHCSHVSRAPRSKLPSHSEYVVPEQGTWTDSSMVVYALHTSIWVAANSSQSRSLPPYFSPPHTYQLDNAR